MSASFRVATHGFSSLEQGLLAQQLDSLQGRTTAPWTYVGESPREAHLLLAMSEDLPLGESMAPFTGHPNSASSGTKQQGVLRSSRH